MGRRFTRKRGTCESGGAADRSGADEGELPLIHRYTLEQLHEYARTVPAEEISFIRRAFEMNMALCQGWA